MKTIKNIFLKSLFFVLSAAGFASSAIADEEVQALVVDNGSGTISVPEPSILSLMLIGVIAIAFIARRNK